MLRRFPLSAGFAVLFAAFAGCGPAEPVAPTAPPSQIIEGTIRGPAGPLAQARVRIKGREPVALSDSAGRYQLPVGDLREGDRITAAKEGFFIGGIPASANPEPLELVPLPERDNADYAWVSPHADPAAEHNCANCHTGIYKEWLASGHAHSATNRRFLNLYAGTDWNGRPNVGWSLAAEHPLGVGVCAACHAPGAEPSDPAIEDLTQLTGVAAEGVHCDFCHKIREVPQQVLGITHGRYAVELLRPDHGQLFFGPLDDVDRGDDAFSPVQLESRYCAACHEGTVFGAHAYGTFTEWEASPAARQGKSCQTCHFANHGGITNIAPGKGGLERNPATLSSHGLFKKSQLAMLRDAVEIIVRSEQADEGSKPSTKVEVTLTPRDIGHRLPTGFPDRHLLLVVEAFDAAGEPLPRTSGETLPAAAGPELAELPGSLFAKVLTDGEGRWPIPFWRAVNEKFDTRLAPGRPYTGAFTFAGRAENVRLRLLHRRFWAETAREKSWPDETLVIHDERYPVK